MHFFMLTADLEQHLSHKNMSNQCGLESDAIGPKSEILVHLDTKSVQHLNSL